jgi:FlaA1/EpsC-like NDP-sugar epimerase
MKPTRHDIYDFISPESGTKNAAEGKTVLITGAGSGIGEVCHSPIAIYFTA